MSRFFPQAPYAEDQTLSKTILTTHVFYRGFQTGATLGILTGLARSIPILRTSSNASSLASALILRSSGVGAAWGTALMAIVTPARMWGREEIEWKDRSWRLLANEWQKEVDDFSLVGTIAGTVAGVLRTNPAQIGRWKVVMGYSGVGSMVGVVGYMAWRYGVHGGKFEKE